MRLISYAKRHASGAAQPISRDQSIWPPGKNREKRQATHPVDSSRAQQTKPLKGWQVPAKPNDHSSSAPSKNSKLETQRGGIRLWPSPARGNVYICKSVYII